MKIEDIYYDIVPYKKKMQEQFNPREGDELIGSMLNRINGLKIKNYSYAIKRGKTLYALVSVYREHEGLWNLIMGFAEGVMTRPSNPVTRHMCALLRTELEEFIWPHNDIRRLQAYIDAGSQINYRFAVYMGFSANAYLEKWGPDGKDYILMARVKE